MSLFRGQRDIAYLKRVARELIENVLGEKFTYYPISKKLSRQNLYGESKEKIVDPPVEVYGIVSWNEQDITTTSFGQDVVFNVGIFVLEEHLVAINLKPTEGDMVDYDGKKFEILSIQEPQQIFGKAGATLGRELVCRSVRESQFTISVSGTIDNPARTSPDNPAKIDNFYHRVTYPYSASV